MPGDVDIERDKKAILGLHAAYLAASSELDEDGFRRIWTADPDFVFFNGNGHTYYGLEHLFRLWKYYRARYVTEEPWKSHNVRLTVCGDMAYLTCERTAKMRWIGEEPAPAFANRPWTSRTTEVLMREKREWKYKHIHISSGAEEPRPGNV